jgi:hypothetical protein
MKLRPLRWVLVFIGVAILLLAVGFTIQRIYFYHPPIIPLADDPTIYNCNIPAPTGWIADCNAIIGNPSPENATPRNSLTDPDNVQIFDYENPSQTSSAQITLYAHRMNLPLLDWINANIVNSGGDFDYGNFKTAQNWSLLNNHLLLSIQQRVTLTTVYYLFNGDVAYQFWFDSAPSPSNMTAMQTMLVNFAATLK